MRQRLILFLTAAVLLSFNTKQEDEDVISWDKNRPLCWRDFKGKPVNNAAAYSSVAILTSIAKSTGNTASVKIQTVFFGSQSWKKNELGAAALRHEQNHFDIAECCARRLRRAIRAQQYSSIKALREKADSLISTNHTELSLYRQQYDAQTSRKGSRKENSWSNTIRTELDILSDQSDPVFVITFR